MDFGPAAPVGPESSRDAGLRDGVNPACHENHNHSNHGGPDGRFNHHNNKEGQRPCS